MPVINTYTIDLNNVGDMFSSPSLYVTFPFEVVRQNILEYDGRAMKDVIFGGGGLLYHWNFGQLVERCTGNLASWGMGHNSVGTDQVVWPSFMKRFALHGIRDWGTPWT